MIDKDGGREKAIGMTRRGVPGKTIFGVPGKTIFEFYILNDQLIAWSCGIGSGALNYIGRSPLLMVEQGRSDAC